MNEFAALPKDVGIDEDVLYAAVFAAKAGLEIVDGFLGVESFEEIMRDGGVHVKIRNRVAGIFRVRVTEHVQLRLIYAQNGAIRPGPLQAYGGVLEKIV